MDEIAQDHLAAVHVAGEENARWLRGEAPFEKPIRVYARSTKTAVSK